MSFDSAFERHDLLDVGSHRSAGQQFHDAIQVLASPATAAQDLEPPGEDGLEVQRYPASRGDATEYQSAIHGQRRDRLLERGGRNMLEDELDPLAPRQFADFLCHPLAGLDNGVGAYAQERVVFGRPIGQNQGIQHPLARNWIELEAAELLWKKAAFLYDQDRPCGAEASAAKYFAGEAGFKACENAVLTHGGMGYAKEFHVERYFREAMLPRIAPVSPQLVLSFIAERVLGLPKSY